jgi:hypothetical protein
MAARHYHNPGYFVSSFGIVLGIILIWRGLWFALDWFDKTFFGGTHWVSVVGGIIVGFLILYLPKHNLSVIRKL